MNNLEQLFGNFRQHKKNMQGFVFCFSFQTYVIEDNLPKIPRLLQCRRFAFESSEIWFSLNPSEYGQNISLIAFSVSFQFSEIRFNVMATHSIDRINAQCSLFQVEQKCDYDEFEDCFGKSEGQSYQKHARRAADNVTDFIFILNAALV